ncbi:MAG TPA: NTP transferase domain-containing protein [Candidatus Limnocylindrales bacterium]|nr:NTP transferase domain-containing protein [Candidatus Limnocylindrales bacterium]
MTVAAVILHARVEGALADAAGRSAARRVVESAWAGGATPIVVVSFDSAAGELAASLAGSPAVLAEPAPVEVGAVGQMLRGITVAAATVTETEAVLIWPGRLTWVDAETVTSLIEAFGSRRDDLLRPTYEGQAGWPVLVPIAAVPAMQALDRSLMPDAVIEALARVAPAVWTVDTGDPGVIHDIAEHLDSLPAYQGPPEPVAGRAPEWGSPAADIADDSPLSGPALAPYAQAAQEGD